MEKRNVWSAASTEKEIRSIIVLSDFHYFMTGEF
jgi:hypothetical protein